MSEGQPLMFWSIERLSLSLFVTSLAPDSRTSRECARGKNILQGLAAPWLVVSLGCGTKAQGQMWLTNSRHFFLTVLSAGSPRSGKQLASSAASPSGCQTADLSLYPHLRGLGDPSSPGLQEDTAPIREGPALITS